MTDEREDLLSRREILLAYITVLEYPGKLIDICGSAVGGAVDLQRAVESGFGISTIAAEAVLDMQVRRFTPLARQQLAQELAEVENSLG